MLHDLDLPGVRFSAPARGDARMGFAELKAARLTEARRADPRYKATLNEAYQFYREVIDEKRPRWQLREAMTQSDFPLIFGDILQRELLGNYASYTPSWPSYVRRRTLPDTTRQARRLAYDGIDTHMTSTNKAPVGTNGPEDNNLTETGYLVGPLDVYERQVSINWEAMLADDLGAFNDLPNRLALAGRRTEEFLVAGLMCDASGPDSTFFAAGHTNLIKQTYGAASDNPALGVQGLIDAMQVWNRMENATTGEKIRVSGRTLVIPPELEVVAKIVFNAIQVETNKNGGDLTGLSNTSGIETRILMNNWLTGGLTFTINEYLSGINSTNGTTAWYVVADPGRNRPAFEIDFLAGETAPILLRKAPDAIRVGGSADMFGSFEGGEFRFKLMHILSVNQLDPLAAIVSNGTGS